MSDATRIGRMDDGINLFALFVRETCRDQRIAASHHENARHWYDAGNFVGAKRNQEWAAKEYAQARAGYDIAFGK